MERTHRSSSNAADSSFSELISIPLLAIIRKRGIDGREENTEPSGIVLFKPVIGLDKF